MLSSVSNGQTLVSTVVVTRTNAVATTARTTSRTTSASPLPTANSDVDGGGNGPGGAPSPGASAAGGVKGPPDDYVASALAIGTSVFSVTVVALSAGAWLALA